MDFIELLKLSNEEREEIIQSGFFNAYIEGYCIKAMQKAGFSRSDIEKLDFHYLFDTVSAADAKKAYDEF